MYIKLQLLLSFLLITSSFTCYKGLKNLYVDTEVPLMTSKVFGSDNLSTKTAFEFGSCYDKQMSEFYFAREIKGKARLMWAERVGAVWYKPEEIFFDSLYNYNDPCLSPDENRLFFISDRPLNALDSTDDYNIWYSKRKESQWETPIPLQEEINTEGNEFYISFTDEGEIFFASNRETYQDRKHNLDLYSAKEVNGIYSKPKKLAGAVNTKGYEGDVFVSKDGSFLILCSARKSGKGQGDLYYSKRLRDGSYGEAILIEEISTKANDVCPYVTPDGKYLMYSSQGDIYWIDSQILTNY